MGSEMCIRDRVYEDKTWYTNLYDLKAQGENTLELLITNPSDKIDRTLDKQGLFGPVVLTVNSER